MATAAGRPGARPTTRDLAAATLFVAIATMAAGAAQPEDLAAVDVPKRVLVGIVLVAVTEVIGKDVKEPVDAQQGRFPLFGCVT